MRIFLPLALLLSLLTAGTVRAWDVIDLANGTNYITLNGTFIDTNYFCSYQITNDTGVAVSNIWVKLGTFTNGASANIKLAGGALNKKSMGVMAVNQAQSFYFFMSGTNRTTSATNAVGIYLGDPDQGGTLLTNRLFTKNWVVAVNTTANGNSAGATSLSTTNPILGGFLVMTSTFTVGSSHKVGLYAAYPAVSNNWDAATFSIVSNTVIIDGNTYPNKMVISVGFKPNTITNIATFRVTSAKPTTTSVSPGAYVNTGQGANPDYISPSSVVNYNGNVLSAIPSRPIPWC